MAEKDIPSGSVIVTPDDMWKAIQETRDGVNELKNLVHPALSDLREDVRDHEKRLQAVEKSSWSSRWLGPLVSGTLVAAVGGAIVWLLSNGAVN